MRALLIFFWVTPAFADVSYKIDLSQRAAHVAVVEMTVRGAASPLELSMPVWTPGAYELRHWGRNLTPLSAENDAGRSVPFTRTGPDGFRVEAGGVVKLRYRIYAPELSDDASQIDGAHAYLNGSSIFLHAQGQEKALHQVHVEAPAGWRVATALEEAPTGWQALGYEALIDAPIEVGKFAHGEVRAAGRLYRVAADGDGEVPANFLRDLAKIAEAETKMVGAPPYRQYLLLIHLSDGIGRIAALEHAASSSVIIPHRSFAGPRDSEAYDELLYVVAHELFHAWNARRLRPAELVPYDLSREQRSRSLWITEGLTEYYAHRALRLAGLWTKARYLMRLGEQASRALESSLRGLTVEEEAELTWQAPDEAIADPDAYYARGHLVALALDAAIRGSGKHSLDDVVKALLAEAELKGGVLAISGDKLAEEISRQSTPAIGAKVAAWTRAPREVEHLDDALAEVGLKLVREESPSRTFAGFAAESDNGSLRVVSVGPSGPAAGAGLRAGDRILRLDGAVPQSDWAERLAQKSPGTAVAVEAVRATRRLLLELRLESTHPLGAHVEEAPATPKALGLRQQLLGG